MANWQTHRSGDVAAAQVGGARHDPGGFARRASERHLGRAAGRDGAQHAGAARQGRGAAHRLKHNMHGRAAHEFSRVQQQRVGVDEATHAHLNEHAARLGCSRHTPELPPRAVVQYPGVDLIRLAAAGRRAHGSSSSTAACGLPVAALRFQWHPATAVATLTRIVSPT